MTEFTHVTVTPEEKREIVSMRGIALGFVQIFMQGTQTNSDLLPNIALDVTAAWVQVSATMPTQLTDIA